MVGRGGVLRVGGVFSVLITSQEVSPRDQYGRGEREAAPPVSVEIRLARAHAPFLEQVTYLPEFLVEYLQS